MKRIVAIICVLACLCGFALPALAAPDTITVTVQVPEDWTNIHLYVWDDTQSALTEWPGTPMNKTNDGRYSLEIPMGYSNLIVNVGSDEKKTADLVGDPASDTWIIVRGSLTEIEFADPGVVDLNAAAPLVNVSLVGEGNADLSWSPEDSARHMTKGSDGSFTKELTMYKGETIKFKLCGNGAWDAGYNYGGETPDIALTAGTAVALVQGNESQNLSYTATQDCTLTVTLDMSGDAPAVTVTEAAAQLAPPPEKVMVKLYVSVAGEFTPNVWAWGDNSNAFANWPGEAMTKEGDWWVIEIPDDCHSAIVNDGVAESGAKTMDLAITMGSVNYIVVDEAWTATVSTSKPDTTKPDTTTPTTPNNPTTPSGEGEGEGEGKKEGGADIFMIVAIALAVLTVGAVVATVIILKKKKG